jgi:hypothetical protein
MQFKNPFPVTVGPALPFLSSISSKKSNYSSGTPSSPSINVNGEAIENSWLVAKPDYIVMPANAQLVENDAVSYGSTYQTGARKIKCLPDNWGATGPRFKA